MITKPSKYKRHKDREKHMQTVESKVVKVCLIVARVLVLTKRITDQWVEGLRCKDGVRSSVIGRSSD